MDQLEKLFGSKVRACLLSLFFSREEERFYLRQLERETGLAIGTIQNEIKQLSKMGLITSEKDGNRLYFEANKKHPLYITILDLVEKTVGIIPQIKKALKGLVIDFAFIYGSVASGEHKATSDIDLMIIGKEGLRKLSSALSIVSQELKREISINRMSKEEFVKKKREKQHFLMNVLKKKKIFLIEDENEFRRLR